MWNRGSIAPAALALTAALLSATPAGADDATCSYSAGTRTVSVVVTPNANTVPTLDRDALGNIRLLDAETGPIACGGTVGDTDTIQITNASTTVPVTLFYINFQLPLAPGFTDEPGTSDEIEVTVDFGPAGGRLALDVTYSTSDPGVPVSMVLGGNQVNLNASEADGVDADVTVNATSGLLIIGSAFDDSIVGSGGAGTPAQPFQVPFEAIGLAGNDLIVGGDGNDGRLIGDIGNDTIHGGAGNDLILPSDGDDVVDAGPGDDEVTDLVGPSGSVPTNGNDSVTGGPGNDLIFTLDGNDVVDGGDGDDTIHAGIGDDSVAGGAGNDRLVDPFSPSTGNDVFLGGPGRDRIEANEGNDVVDAGPGKDKVFAGAGDDTANGAGGNDRLFGAEGKDRLRGKGGRDRLFGEEGNDKLNGGLQLDWCYGGAGTDEFVLCEVVFP